MMIKSKERVLPTESFWQAIATEKLEDRLEFTEWGGSGEAEVKCGEAGATISDCEASAKAEAHWGEQLAQ